MEILKCNLILLISSLKNVAEGSGEAGFPAGSLALCHQSVPVPAGVS